MGKHSRPSASGLPQTIDDDTWELVTATEEWEATPAAGSQNPELN